MSLGVFHHSESIRDIPETIRDSKLSAPIYLSYPKRRTSLKCVTLRVREHLGMTTFVVKW
jgi:hypothetical protein